MRLTALFKSIVVKGLIGIAGAAFLTFVSAAVVSTPADATPALAKGKPCNACHTGNPPTKGNVKK